MASLVLGFVFGTTGLLLAPGLGQIAGPTLCGGALIHNPSEGWLRFSCVERGGRIRPAPAEQVLLHTVAICAVAAIVPVSLLFRSIAAGEQRRRQSLQADLAAARPARAEVMRVGASANLKRQMLMHAAELHLTLWITPLGGRPYEAEVTWFVEQEQIAQFVVGASLPVRVNLAHPERVYPVEEWAQLVGWERST